MSKKTIYQKFKKTPKHSRCQSHDANKNKIPKKPIYQKTHNIFFFLKKPRCQNNQDINNFRMTKTQYINKKPKMSRQTIKSQDPRNIQDVKNQDIRQFKISQKKTPDIKNKRSQRNPRYQKNDINKLKITTKK